MKVKLFKYILLIILLAILSITAGELVLRGASVFLPGVRYMATAGVEEKLSAYDTLENFIKYQRHLTPHNNWQNYYTNAFGFNDTEFVEKKADGVFRIVSMGDSFCFSLLPYPANVLTLVESHLEDKLSNVKVELYNFGISSTGASDHRKLFPLIKDRFAPDLALLHFYIGNDGPNIYQNSPDIPSWRYSHLANYLKNTFILFKSVKRSIIISQERRDNISRKGFWESTGGGLVDPKGPTHRDQPERYLGPTFNEQTYIRLMANELGRLYSDSDKNIDKVFAPVLEEIDRIRIMAENSGLPLVLVVYPSQLQIYPELREIIIRKVKALPEYHDLDLSKIDAKLPNRILEQYSSLNGLSFLDLTDELAKTATTKPFLHIKNDTHWNIQGNSIAAEIEAEGLGRLIENLSNE